MLVCGGLLQEELTRCRRHNLFELRSIVIDCENARLLIAQLLNSEHSACHLCLTLEALSASNQWSEADNFDPLGVQRSLRLFVEVADLNLSHTTCSWCLHHHRLLPSIGTQLGLLFVFFRNHLLLGIVDLIAQHLRGVLSSI